MLAPVTARGADRPSGRMEVAAPHEITHIARCRGQEREHRMSDDEKAQEAHNIAQGHPHDDDLHWSIVKKVETEDEATLMVGYLRANDIPAQVESLRFNEMPVNLGDMAEVRVRVPEERAEAASRLLAERETADLSAEADAAERAVRTGEDPV